jgi:SAM-dependent methyltransferase
LNVPDPKLTNLAEKTFWEDEYFGDVSLPARPDPNMPFERCLAHDLAAHACVEPASKVLEIGCAPAKWLVFYAERFGATVEGIEYSAKGVELSRMNMSAAGVEGTVHEADFFEFEPKPFDLVLSLGFIEHFDDVDRAFAQHVKFVGPRGRLAIGVPNYRGLNRVLQRWSDPAHLRLHNADAMEPSLYRRLAASHGLEVVHLGYLGGFDPIIVKLGRRSARPAIMLEAFYRRLRLADRLNHRLLSSYLLTVLRKP